MKTHDVEEQSAAPTERGIDRRRFLKTIGEGALTGAALGLFPELSSADRSSERPASGDRGFWSHVRSEFVLDRRTTYMNIGTTGSTPRDVLKQYAGYNHIVAKDPWEMGGEFYTWPHTTQMADAIAGQFGSSAGEIILSRNTTDGMCSILGGLNLQPGDEILTTHHEHVAALSPLSIIAERFGVTVRKLEIPVFPTSEDDYIQVFANALTPATRLIVFSHITYKTGARLPAKRICQEVAIPNGIATLIDGAHSIGMLNLDFHDIDCDFYAGSGHKWQCGPGATGILYVRDQASRVAGYWSDRSPVYWPVNSSLAEYGFLGLQTQLAYIGNDNYPAKKALTDVCNMWEEIGRDRIESYVLGLGAYCKSLLREAFPTAVIYSPDAPELNSGLSSFNPFIDQTDGATLTTFRDRLREEYGFIIRTTNFKVNLTDAADSNALRISTHLFHNKRDVEKLVEAMTDLYSQMA